MLRSGQAMRTYGVARALAAHGGLDLLYVRFGAQEPDAAFRAIPGITLHAVEPSRGLRRAAELRTRAPARRAREHRPRGLARAARTREEPERRRGGAGG